MPWRGAFPTVGIVQSSLIRERNLHTHINELLAVCDHVAFIGLTARALKC